MECDFTSTALDVERALCEAEVVVPFDELPLSNLAQARRLLPPQHPHALDDATRDNLAVKRAAALASSASRDASKAASPDAGNVATAIVAAYTSFEPAAAAAATVSKPRSLAQQFDESCRDGPLLWLREQMERRVRVRVIVDRPERPGARGCYEGRLVLFDRHWNVLLDKVSRHFDDAAAASLSGQVLIRGASVLFVHCAS